MCTPRDIWCLRRRPLLQVMDRFYNKCKSVRKEAGKPVNYAHVLTSHKTKAPMLRHLFQGCSHISALEELLLRSQNTARFKVPYYYFVKNIKKSEKSLGFTRATMVIINTLFFWTQYSDANFSV